LPWHLAEEPRHAGVRSLVRDLNRVYRGTPALHRLDHDSAGFAWLAWQDEAQSVVSFLRKGGDEQHVVVILNFTPVPREGYRVGVPRLARYREILNSDSQYYGGSNVGNDFADAEPTPWMDQPCSIVVRLPPLGGIVLVPG
jgi:1,4-alpha-glucan branching enzyme